MSEGRAIARNLSWLVAGQALHRALAFVAVAYAARILGAETFGALSFAFAFVTLSFLFSDVGVNLLAVREYGKSGEDRDGLMATLWYLKLAFLAGSTGIAAVLYALVPTPVSPALFWLVLAVVATDLVRDFFTAAARAIERGAIEGAVLAIDGAVTAGLGILFLFLHGTVESLALGYAVAGALGCLLAYALVRRRGVRFLARPRWAQARALLRTIWPFAFAAIMALSFTQVDVLLLGWIAGPEAAGYYAPGSRIVQILFMLPLLIGAAILPALSRAPDAASRARITGRALSLLLMLGIPAAVGGAILAGPVLGLLYGPAFLPGAASFAVLLLMFLAYAVALLLDHYLLSADLQNRNFRYTAVAAVANVVLALAFIPRWGILGAAGASLLAQLANAALTARLTRRSLGTGFVPWADVGRYALASAAMAAFLLAVPLQAWLAIPAAAGIYLALLALMRAPLLRGGLALLRGA